MAKEIYQVLISLKGFTPEIWRRIQIYSDTLLPDLHRIIQTTMGWTNSHLHQFIKDRRFYSEPSPEDEMDSIDYRKIKVLDLLKKEKDKIIYEYDFGDGWEHEVLLEKILPIDLTSKYPVCLAGKMNCPPEDCGGVWGYSDMLAVLKDKSHEEYESYIHWLGGDFDPTGFDLDMINKMLKRKDFGCIEL